MFHCLCEGTTHKHSCCYYIVFPLGCYTEGIKNCKEDYRGIFAINDPEENICKSSNSTYIFSFKDVASLAISKSIIGFVGLVLESAIFIIFGRVQT